MSMRSFSLPNWPVKPTAEISNSAGRRTNTNSLSSAASLPVTLGRGGEEYGTHTLKEWFNPKGVYACEQKSILMLSVLAGLDGVIAPLDKA